MYTSFLFLALSGAFPQFSVEEPKWQSYWEAQKQGTAEKKPLAIFVGNGAEGWTRVIQGGALGKENQSLLTKDYLCVYADTATDLGKKIAAAFEVTGDRGLVICSRGGDLQAFHHIGDLSQRDLGWYLTRYADPEHVVRTTETHGTVRTSNYPPTQPIQYQQFQGFGGGRSC
jgi:hypothetical protein